MRVTTELGRPACRSLGPVTVDASKALERLRRALEAGELDADLQRMGVGLLVAFGSAVRPNGTPKDLDIAAAPVDGAPARTIAQLDLATLLMQVTRYAHVDVGIIDGTHPVFDAEALAGLPLYEHRKGAFAQAQMRAYAHRRDTARFRDLDLAQWAAEAG